MNVDRALHDRLIEHAAARYRPAGRFAFHFARGKLRRDPLFETLLRVSAIPDAHRLVDLGCGQGLLGAWLAAWFALARRDGIEPRAPVIDEYCGVDRSKSDVARARLALPDARIIEADLRSFDLSALAPCDVIALLDVLHYIEPDGQRRLLIDAHSALRDTGTLLMRIGDGSHASASRRANGVDLIVCALRGQPRSRLYRRSVDEWTALLSELGFDAEMLDDDRTRDGRKRKYSSFANVLLRATKRGALLRAK